ncbi:hypothetical protein HF265_15900 [Rhizobium leguminosarum]|uniref:hypothetical protein n=1 Tax=Rhizobium leguminosarum TaxID=384 RepID=UPI001C917539|nr:hypothetical protein [Rhizobium leguminosarum]MBY3030575.1 hypothetical protein [Rhizobium leguminosarum]
MRDSDNLNAREDATPDETADQSPSVAEPPKYLFWATILLLAGALSVFSFATGLGNLTKSTAAQSGWLSIWQNTPNFKFLVTFFLIAACLGFIVSCRDFSSAWANVRRVLESGVFYFFAGLGLLLYAKQGTDAAEHPSITFILAMLGVAIMLFGTGSQAAGAIATAGGTLPTIPSKASDVAATEEAASAGTPSSGDWSPFKANAVIAGGAAVLTAIFGFGVIHFADKIPGVFQDYGGYNRIMIRPCLADASRSCTETDISSFTVAKNLSLADYSVSAENADGRELFIRKEDKTIQVLALKDELRSGQYISLRFDRIGNAPIGILLAPSVSVDVPVANDRQGSPSGCATDPATAASRCRLSKTDNGSFNRDDNTSLVTFTLDLSGRVQPDKGVQTTQLDPTSKAVKPVSYDLQ